MYRFVSKYGNRIVYTENEREKNQLLKEGFNIDTKYKDAQTKKESVPNPTGKRSKLSSKGEVANEQTDN